MNNRGYVFIDGSNVDMAAKASFDRRVSPELLVGKLVGERRLMRANYYESPLLPGVNRETFDKQQRFFEHLRMNPFFNLRLGRRVQRQKTYTCLHCGKEFQKTSFEQKGVDTLIVFDLIALATRDAYDIAILVAGDQDFVLPVLEVRMMNKYVENAFTQHAWASELKQVTDKTTLLDEEFLNGCWQK